VPIIIKDSKPSALIVRLIFSRLY